MATILSGTEPVLARILSEQRFAVLSTQGKDGPYTNLIAFAVDPTFTTLYFATPRASHKYANLMLDPRVALLIDDCTNAASDLEQATAITALGVASEVADAQRELVQSIYLTRHPGLEAFLAAEGTALFSVSVSRYIVVGPFQHVRHIVLAAPDNNQG